MNTRTLYSSNVLKYTALGTACAAGSCLVIGYFAAAVVLLALTCIQVGISYLLYKKYQDYVASLREDTTQMVLPTYEDWWVD